MDCGCQKLQLYPLAPAAGILSRQFGKNGFKSHHARSSAGPIDVVSNQNLGLSGSATSKVVDSGVPIDAFPSKFAVVQNGRLYAWDRVAGLAAIYRLMSEEDVASSALPFVFGGASPGYVPDASLGDFCTDGLVQIGSDDDWEEVKSNSYGQMLARKRDGSLWAFGAWQSGTDHSSVDFEGRFRGAAMPDLRNIDSRPFRMMLSASISEFGFSLPGEWSVLEQSLGLFPTKLAPPVWFTAKPEAVRVAKLRLMYPFQNDVLGFEPEEAHDEPGEGAAVSMTYRAKVDVGCVRSVSFPDGTTFGTAAGRYKEFDIVGAEGEGAKGYYLTGEGGVPSTVVVTDPGWGYAEPLYAEFDNDFRTRVPLLTPALSPGIEVIDGGAYLGVPDVMLRQPADGEYAPPPIAVRVSEMSKSAILRFEVTAGGAGYTFARVVEPKTGASGSATISQGRVIGWSLDSAGSATHSPLEGEPLRCFVVGDGQGAAAEAIPAPSSVLAVELTDNPETWTEPPEVVFSGGNGTGAVAIVPGIIGQLHLEVTNGGGGYTKTGLPTGYLYSNKYAPCAVVTLGAASHIGGRVMRPTGEVVAGEALLSPSPVVRVARDVRYSSTTDVFSEDLKIQAPEDFEANNRRFACAIARTCRPRSSGVVLPFEVRDAGATSINLEGYTYNRYHREHFLWGSGFNRMDLSVSDGVIRLDSPYASASPPAMYAKSYAMSPFFSRRRARLVYRPVGVSGYPYLYGVESGVHAWRVDFETYGEGSGSPIFKNRGQYFTASGPEGSSSTFYVNTMGGLNYASPSVSGLQIGGGAPPSSVVGEDVESLGLEYEEDGDLFLGLAKLQDPVRSWIPPSDGTRIHLVAHRGGETAAYAMSECVFDESLGYPVLQSFEVIEPGDGYTSEPRFLLFNHEDPFPRDTGLRNCTDAAISDEMRAVAVCNDENGTYWWGMDSATMPIVGVMDGSNNIAPDVPSSLYYAYEGYDDDVEPADVWKWTQARFRTGMWTPRPTPIGKTLKVTYGGRIDRQSFVRLETRGEIYLAPPVGYYSFHEYPRPTYGNRIFEPYTRMFAEPFPAPGVTISGTGFYATRDPNDPNIDEERVAEGLRQSWPFKYHSEVNGAVYSPGQVREHPLVGGPYPIGAGYTEAIQPRLLDGLPDSLSVSVELRDLPKPERLASVHESGLGVFGPDPGFSNIRRIEIATFDRAIGEPTVEGRGPRSFGDYAFGPGSELYRRRGARPQCSAEVNITEVHRFPGETPYVIYSVSSVSTALEPAYSIKRHERPSYYLSNGGEGYLENCPTFSTFWRDHQKRGGRCCRIKTRTRVLTQDSLDPIYGGTALQYPTEQFEEVVSEVFLPTDHKGTILPFSYSFLDGWVPQDVLYPMTFEILTPGSGAQFGQHLSEGRAFAAPCVFPPVGEYFPVTPSNRGPFSLYTAADYALGVHGGQLIKPGDPAGRVGGQRQSLLPDGYLVRGLSAHNSAAASHSIGTFSWNAGFFWGCIPHADLSTIYPAADFVAVGPRGYPEHFFVRTQGASGSRFSVYHTDYDNRIYLASRPRLISPGVVALTSAGEGYDYPAVAAIDQPDGVATGSVEIDGRLVAVAVIDGGDGYRSPPVISFDREGCAAVAEIAGPVSRVDVSDGGQGYLLPPRVVFSGPGLPASATATLTNGAVSSVTVQDGGRYRTAPGVSFVPRGVVSSIAVTSGGRGYTFPPNVFVEGGASARAVLSGDSVSAIEVLSGGPGYDIAPLVVINGGGGFGATGVASLSYYGSGASATAEISGEVVSVVVTGHGEGLQNPPAAVAGHPQGEGDGRRDAKLQAVILGRPSSVSVLRGGDHYCHPNYEFYDDDDVPDGIPQGIKRLPSYTVRRPLVYATGSVCMTDSHPLRVLRPGSGVFGRYFFYDYGFNDGLPLNSNTLGRQLLRYTEFRESGENDVLSPAYFLGTAELDGGESGDGGSVVSVNLHKTVTKLRIVDGGGGFEPYRRYYVYVNYSDAELDIKHRSLVVWPSLPGETSPYPPTQGHDFTGFTAFAGPDGKIVAVLELIRINDIDSSNHYTSPPRYYVHDIPEGGAQPTFEPVLDHPLNCYHAPIALFDGHIQASVMTSLTEASAAVQRDTGVIPCICSGEGPSLPYWSAWHKTNLFAGNSLLYGYGVADARETVQYRGQRNKPKPLRLPKMRISLVGEVAGFAPRFFDPPEGWSEEDKAAEERIFGFFSTPPELVVEDERGAGAILKGLQPGPITLASVAAGYIESGGAGYTLGARLRLRGGVPLAKTSPVVANAVIINGVVSRIDIASPGGGYTNLPAVLIVGDGVGASAAITRDCIQEGDGSILRIPVTAGGSGYTSASVVVIDRERSADESEAIASLHRLLDAKYSVLLRECVVESAVIPKELRAWRDVSFTVGAKCFETSWDDLDYYDPSLMIDPDDGYHYSEATRFLLEAAGVTLHQAFEPNGTVAHVGFAAHSGDPPPIDAKFEIIATGREPESDATATVRSFAEPSGEIGDITNGVVIRPHTLSPNGGHLFPPYQVPPYFPPE